MEFIFLIHIKNILCSICKLSVCYPRQETDNKFSIYFGYSLSIGVANYNLLTFSVWFKL